MIYTSQIEISITAKNSITAALNIETTIDNSRLIAAAFSEGARDSLAKTMKNSPKNLANALLQNGELIDGTINLVSRATTLDNYVYEGDLAREGLRQGIKGAIITGNLTYQGVLLAGDMAYKGAAIVGDGAIVAGDLTYNSSLLIPDVLIGTNLSSFNPIISNEGKAGIRRTSQDAILGTLPWLSRVIDENNNERNNETGEVINNPAPNFLPGMLSGNDKANTGISSLSCRESFLCRNTFSDQALHFYIPNRITPFFHSGSAFHDAGNYKDWKNQATIIPYLTINQLGAIGTLLDIPNWQRNFVDDKANIFGGGRAQLKNSQ